jgi:hypothetical protein
MRKLTRRCAVASAALIGGAALTGGNVLADTVIPDDLIVQGSTCTGFDCVNNENFGFDTLILKENNLRILFLDTSTSTGFPTNDWRITANDSASGGANFLAIEDATAGRQVFRVDAGAPQDALRVSSSGNVGIGTATPVLDLSIRTADTPAQRFEQDASGGFSAQTWDVAGNEANFFVRDVTGGSRLPFRIRPGAPTSSLDIAASGNVGIGTASPNERLTASGAVVATASRAANPNAQAATTVAIVDISGDNARFAAGSNGSNNKGISLSTLNAGAPTTAVEINAAGRTGFGAVPSTGQRVDVAGGVSMTGGLHVGSMPTYASNACRSTLGQTVPGFFSIGDCASDARLKHDIRYLGEGALARVLALQPATFGWNGEPSTRRHAGFIAQDTLPHVPEAVGISPSDGYYTWDSNAVLAYTVKALQELDRKVESVAVSARRAPAGGTTHPTGTAPSIDTARLEATVRDLLVVIGQQQQRIEALERRLAP